MQVIPTAPNLKARMRKFRFIVTNSGPDGQMSMREQPQIGIAPSPQYLINLYAQGGDKIRILEELPPDGETRNYGKVDIAQMAGAVNETGWAAGGNLAAGKMLDVNASDEQLRALQAMHGGKAPETPLAVPTQNDMVQQPQPTPTPAPVPPVQQSQPSYFKVGNTECKMENGKVYQKQWMRVTETDMANYRLISDKNNKILPMDGKHLEVLKWVIAEDD